MNKHQTFPPGRLGASSGRSKEGDSGECAQLGQARREGARLDKQTPTRPFVCLMPDSRSTCLCTSLRGVGVVSPVREGNE